ncbi:UrcA family protein [Sphingomonas sp. G124]|uniref:UrcA family protein n=1 Tax=Sphingomonas cremea TaxID=2904799 RepID=A0A9X1TZK9_9SPHN|nr:UrcA family protein [Sphingomonas cremea]MCF2515932.1 UrcA family protein [Sphingomonas cremea]
MLARFNRKTAAVLSGVTASLLVAASASAAQQGPVVVYAEPDNVRTERVTYADLNLADRADQRKLGHRVTGAVKRVCLFENSRSGLQDAGYYGCADDAWDGAKPQIAQAIQRAKDIAMTGKSSIAATAISINVASR